MGKYLGQMLQDRLGSHKNVGEVRGRGLVWGVELVKNKTTKEPFPVADKISPTIHAAGLKLGISILPGGGVADGTNGDVVVLAPAYNITRADVEFIVDKTAQAVEQILGPTRAAKL